MDFLTDTDTDIDQGWHDYQEVFDQLEDFEVASLDDDLPAIRKIDWTLPS